jgi:hypothetical protein
LSGGDTSDELIALSAKVYLAKVELIEAARPAGLAE